MTTTNGNHVNGKTIEAEVIEWYIKGEPIKDILEAFGLKYETKLYDILRAHSIPLRGQRKITNVKLTPAPATSAPKREWFLIDECAHILGMNTADIEWLIHKGQVHADTSETATGGKFTLVYLPSLVDAQSHAGIDGKRAKQLLAEAHKMLDRVARQKTININDANFICGAIHDYFVANGWKLDGQS